MTSEQLDAYFQASALRREARFEEQQAALTEREKQLVREAAVMGYVRGSMYGQSRNRSEADEQFPKDSEILRDVFGGCEAHSDIYPLISHLGDDDEEHFLEWLATQEGVTEEVLANITDDQRHNAYMNYLKRADEEEDENE